MTPTTATRRETCRACGHGPLTDLFSLGDQYVSGFPESWEDPPQPQDYSDEPLPVRCPIDLVHCAACTLVQQRYTVPSELLYTRHYWYRSGVTDTMRRALAGVVDAAMDRVRLSPGDVVLDIGSNDGTLLRQYPEALHLNRIGVEPAKNLATRENYEDRNIGCVRGFWGTELWADDTPPAPHPAKIITACGMMYDLENPLAFLRAVYFALAPDGVFVAQLQCLRQTVRLRDVGNFCHEHLEFYTLASLLKLYAAAGLVVERVEENDVNGGSYRLYARRAEAAKVDETVGDAVGAESDMGLYDPLFLRRFGDELKTNMANLWQTVRSIVGAGKTVWVYGASTKGNVILQAAGIDSTLIKYAADRSPEKWDRVMAGSGILIRTEEEFRANRPDFAMVLPYAFLPEFTEREKAWRLQGGRWIVPLPEVKVV